LIDVLALAFGNLAGRHAAAPSLIMATPNLRRQNGHRARTASRRPQQHGAFTNACLHERE
jgi:hypothetical protein